MPVSLRACLIALLYCASAAPVLAASADEASRLTLVLQQLANIETLAGEAEAGAGAGASATDSERYFFDYPRLHQDLQRMRQGVQGYLSPSRAQPRDPAELSGAYRTEVAP